MSSMNSNQYISTINNLQLISTTVKITKTIIRTIHRQTEKL